MRTKWFAVIRYYLLFFRRWKFKPNLDTWFHDNLGVVFFLFSARAIKSHFVFVIFPAKEKYPLTRL